MQIRQEAKQAVKYGAVGVLNTMITAVVYYLLRKIDFSVDGANLISYEAGFLNSYIWNRLWVFQSHQNDWRKEGLIFWVGAHICWALQWLAFRLFLQFLAEVSLLFKSADKRQEILKTNDKAEVIRILTE